MKLTHALLLTLSAVNCNAAINATFDIASSINDYSKAPASDPSSVINWGDGQGNPGGALIYTEAADGGLDRLSLSSDFLGDRSAYFGGTFDYDFYFTSGNGSITTNNRDNDVEFVGGGITLKYNLSLPEAQNSWLNRSLQLDDTADWVNSGTGVAATNTEIQTVLADLTAIYIIADYGPSSIPDSTRFDNISLVPEPSQAALLAGLAAIGIASSRRRR